MAKKRPTASSRQAGSKKQRQATSGQRPKLPQSATGVVSTRGAPTKRKKKEPSAPVEHGGRKALVTRPSRGVNVAESVSLWNVFRAKTLDETTRKTTVDAALLALSGKLYEASLKHDSARVVQALHKFGDAEQREKIEAELVPRLPELAIRPYARHVALALVKRAANSQQRSARCRAFRGKFRQTAVHAVGAKVADALLETAPKRDAMLLKCELYAVPDAALLKAETLTGILAEVPERRHAQILLEVDKTLSKLCDKGLAHYGFAHDLLWERVSASNLNVRELASRTAEAHPHFVSTRSGARASALLATAADAKTRKGLLKKCWRGRAAQAAQHARAHVALIRFLDVVDDTKQSGALISGEIGPAAAELALDACGAQVLLSLLGEPTAKPLSADVKDVLKEDPASVTVEDKPASRKAREVRRGELVAHLAPGLKRALYARAPELLASRAAAPVIIAALAVTPLAGDAELLERVARACVAPLAAFESADEAAPAANPHFGGGEAEDEDEAAARQVLAGSDEAEAEAGAASLIEDEAAEDDAGSDDDGDSDDDEASDSEDSGAGAFFEKSDDDSEGGAAAADAGGGADWGVADAAASPPVLDHDVAHRTLLTLLQAKTDGFAAAFARVAGETGGLGRWAGSNRGGLVMAALVRGGHGRKELGAARKALAKAKKVGSKGAAALLEALGE